MNQKQSDKEAAPEELKEWETPELIIEDVAAVTRGGGGPIGVDLGSYS